jgi:hypothetical protein
VRLANELLEVLVSSDDETSDQPDPEIDVNYDRYEADHRYALPTTAFFMATILLFAAAHFFNLWVSDSIRMTRAVRLPTAIARFLSYRAY